MKDVKFYWWKCVDLIGFFKELGFSERAIKDAGVVTKRIEFYPEELLLRVKETREGVESSHGGGHNFTHTCPPECNGD